MMEGGRSMTTWTMPFLSTLRVKNIHVEVSTWSKRAKLCLRSYLKTFAAVVAAVIVAAATRAAGYCAGILNLGILRND